MISDKAKRWLLGALLVALGVVLGIKGYLGPAFEFLDGHSWIVTAAAATVTAIATLYIARFTRGTWELFRLEKERVEATGERLERALKGQAARLWGLLQVVDFYFESVDPPDRTADVRESVAEILVRGLSTVEERLESIRDEAIETPADLPVKLGPIRAVLGYVIFGLAQNTETTDETLRKTRDALERLLELLPSDEQERQFLKDFSESFIRQVLTGEPVLGADEKEKENPPGGEGDQ